MLIAIAAGESSGDALGAGLVAALAARVPGARFVGIAGPKMRAAGCEAWHRTEELSVMGLAEVLRHLPRLLRLRRDFARRLFAEPPAVFVGIDSPDFNLPLAAKLRRAGIRTVQYVSPQVWAWRQARVRSIARAVDSVLCVLPFETEFYAAHGVDARFVGHPLADEIPLEVDREGARAALGLDRDAPLLALLPGSRHGEISRLARPFAETALWLAGRVERLGTAVAIAHEGLEADWTAATRDLEGAGAIARFVGRARDVMSAADVVLTASGTASLEAMLLTRPMVVAYKMSPFSYWLLRHMGIQKLPFYSLPNLLAGREIAAEFVQGSVRAELLGPALMRCLKGSAEAVGRADAAAGERAAAGAAAAGAAAAGAVGAGADPSKLEAMRAIHERLRRGGSDVAAAAVLEIAARGRGQA